jgi:hypothetical protein
MTPNWIKRGWKNLIQPAADPGEAGAGAGFVLVAAGRAGGRDAIASVIDDDTIAIYGQRMRSANANPVARKLAAHLRFLSVPGGW